MEPRFTVQARRRGTVHIHRWWEVHRDGEFLDAYEDRALAVGYADLMNDPPPGVTAAAREG